MKLTTKINLMTAAWVLCILLAVNAIVFFSFLKITVDVEKDSLSGKVSNILHSFDAEELFHIDKSSLAPYLAGHSYIRIIQPNSKVVNEVASDPQLAAKIAGKSTIEETYKTYTIRLAQGEEKILVVRTPIKSHGKVIGTLEIGEKLLGLELGKDILLSILVFCTLLGGVLSLLGGRWLSNLIIRPVSNMIDTMEDIEQSGIPKRIIIQHMTKDELQKMAETFNRMIGRLDANLEKQQQFISDASHELKTPITVIKSYADLLRRRGFKNEIAATDAVEIIHSEAGRIQKMTEKLLDLANTEVENKLEKKPFDMVHLCQSILKQLKDAYKRDIFLHHPHGPLVVKADELKIKQVIIILLDNAIKYSTAKIDVFLEVNEQFIRISVKDYGIGIPKHELANIFERFYRVDKARSRETGGTGLGLAIAKNIVKQHNGEIIMKSQEGIGTEAVLLLPREDFNKNHGME